MWSYKAGRKGVNRVRVYERRDSTALFVEWVYSGRRYQRKLEFEGHPITDKRLAMKHADEMARRLKQDHNRAARGLMFPGPHTLGGLLAVLHEASRWRPSTRTSNETFRRYWLEALGEDTPLTEIGPAMVERASQQTAEEKGWSPKTLRDYRAYLVTAYRYAERKLKVIEARDNLSAVDLPKLKSRGTAYSLAETRRLLPALEDEDIRAGWIGHVCYLTGRRLRAVTHVLKEHVTLEDDYATIQFVAETDKAGQDGLAVIGGRALELTRILMARPGRYVLGVPPRKELAIKGWLRRAEEAAGVPHVQGRGYHALKRRYAGETEGLRGRDKQSGTLDTTLRVRYKPDDLAPKIEVAKALNRILEA